MDLEDEEKIENDIEVEQDTHQPYFSIPCSSIHCRIVASSGAG
jgi:hypothetical protein